MQKSSDASKISNEMRVSKGRMSGFRVGFKIEFPVWEVEKPTESKHLDKLNIVTGMMQ